jgi:hypothetical protein
LQRRANYLDWLRQQRVRRATEAVALVEQNVDATNGRLVAIRDELVELTNATLEVVREYARLWQRKVVQGDVRLCGVGQ